MSARARCVYGLLAVLLALAALLSAATERAAASVSSQIATRMAALVDTLRLDEVPGGVRAIRVNGLPFRTELAYAPEHPDEILDQLERAAQAEFEALSGPLTEAQRSAVALRRPTRIDGEDYGIFLRLVGGPLERPTDVMERFAAGEGLGPDAEGAFAVLALRPEGQSQTAVWTLRFSEAFHPSAMAPGADGDVGGGDLAGIRRFPGSRRVFRFDESSDSGLSGLAAYEGEGSPEDRLRFYTRELRVAGLTQAEPSHNEDGVLMRFAGSGREVVIFSSYDPGRDRVLDLIQVRGGHPEAT